MVQIRRVLAATDLSTPARRAAERAARLAKEVGATLDLVHVAPVSAVEQLRRLVADLPPELPQRMLDDADKALRSLAAALQQQHGIRPDVHLATGPLIDEITRLIASIPADLAVFGARGAGFMRHLLLGSTAERLVGRSSRPTLVVKRAAHAPYSSVLVSVDFSDASLAALQCALAVAPHARIAVLHAYEAPFEGKMRQAGIDGKTLEHYQGAARLEAQHSLHALCLQAGPAAAKMQGLVLHGPPVFHILEQEQELDCDLIVVGKHGQSRVEDLLLGSVTRRVLAESRCDVMVST